MKDPFLNISRSGTIYNISHSWPSRYPLPWTLAVHGPLGPSPAAAHPEPTLCPLDHLVLQNSLPNSPALDSRACMGLFLY